MGRAPRRRPPLRHPARGIQGGGLPPAREGLSLLEHRPHSGGDPYEAGLGFCVRLGKGEFIGRDALRGIKADGIQRKLCTVTLTTPLPDDADLYGGEGVYAGGQVMGRLRSGGWGYTVGKHIGYVYLPLDLVGVGTRLEVEAFGQRCAAEVASDVLYDPEGTRLRQ